MAPLGEVLGPSQCCSVKDGLCLPRTHHDSRSSLMAFVLKAGRDTRGIDVTVLRSGSQRGGNRKRREGCLL